jgi:pimeloyl-ACP methyl ester carboxylesterase
MVTLLARVDAETVHWVGTSMGGLIGMALAAQQDTPISRLVLNDVGPVITAASIARIGEYVGKAPRFASVEQAEAFLRVVSAPFGALSDREWRHLTVHALRQSADGPWEMAYDPGIAEPFRAAMGEGKDIELWPLYEAIRCPTLLVRGGRVRPVDRRDREADGWPWPASQRGGNPGRRSRAGADAARSNQHRS